MDGRRKFQDLGALAQAPGSGRLGGTAAGTTTGAHHSVAARRRARPVSTWSNQAALDSPPGRGAPGHASGRRLNRWWEVSANGHSLAGNAGEGFEEVAEGGDA